MSSAHVFYIPILIAMGFIGGFFAGRRAAEQEAVDAQKRLQRQKKVSALRKAQADDEPTGDEDKDA